MDTEFYNQQLKAVLTAANMMLYSTGNEEKASVVELVPEKVHHLNFMSVIEYK